MSDFRWFSVLSNVQIKLETLYGASSFRIICSIGLSFPQSSLLLRLVQTLWYRPKNTKTIWPCPYCNLGNILTVRQERNVTWYLHWSDRSKSVAFLVEALWYTWCLTSTETIRLIRDGEKGEGVWRWGKTEGEYIYTYHYTVTTRMLVKLLFCPWR